MSKGDAIVKAINRYRENYGRDGVHATVERLRAGA